MITLLFLAWNENHCGGVSAFTSPSRPAIHDLHRSFETSLAAEGFRRSAVKERPPRETTKSVTSHDDALSAADAKRALIELIPRMTGKDEEYRAVESYVNFLEDKYVPVQTIDFLNLAMTGEWQLVGRDSNECLNSYSFPSSYIYICFRHRCFVIISCSRLIC